MKRRISFFLVLALLLAVVALPVAAQSFPDPGAGSTITELANKTANQAQVNIVYYDQAGSMVPGPTRTIPGNGSIAIDPASTSLPQGFNGAGVASSNQPLAAVVETGYTGGPGDGYQMGFYSGVSAGSSKICFPSLWKFPGSIISSFTVQNTGTSAAAVDINYMGRDGVSQGTRSDTIPVGAQHTYDLATPTATMPNLPANWEGSASVAVTNGGQVAGVGVVNWGSSVPTQTRTGDYNAAECAGLTGATTLVVPTHFRVRPGGNWTNGIWSAVNVQNLSTSPANVTFTYTDRGGAVATPPLVLTATIPAQSTWGANTRNGGNFLATAFDPLNGDQSWDGAVTIVSDQPIVATVITQWDRNGSWDAGVYAAANQSTGATKFFVPNVKRIVSGGNWQKFSAVIVQNLGSSSAAINVAFYNRAGTKVLEFNDNVAAAAAFGYNTNNGGNRTAAEFVPLGDAFEGHVVVTSTNGQPLAVVLNGIARTPGGASGVTNGIAE